MEQVWYEIRVGGHISAGWSDWLGGLEIVNEQGGEAVLRGPLIDQAALHGVLAQVHALNLDLLGLRRIAGGRGAEQHLGPRSAPG